jgi:hypothetical protein
VASRRTALFIRFNNGDPGILQGHVVALSKTEENAVVRAKADDSDKMPAIGFVKRADSSKVIVQLNSVFKWPDAASVSIDSGTEYWVDTTAGQITDDPSGISSGRLQIVGVGKKSPHHILVRMDPLGIDL